MGQIENGSLARPDELVMTQDAQATTPSDTAANTLPAVRAPSTDAPRTPPHPPLPGQVHHRFEGIDPLDPDAYLNRELTWLNFAWRVLH